MPTVNINSGDTIIVPKVIGYTTEVAFCRAALCTDLILINPHNPYTGNIDDYLVDRSKNPHLDEKFLNQINLTLSMCKDFIHQRITELLKNYKWIIVR